MRKDGELGKAVEVSPNDLSSGRMWHVIETEKKKKKRKESEKEKKEIIGKLWWMEAKVQHPTCPHFPPLNQSEARNRAAVGKGGGDIHLKEFEG